MKRHTLALVTSAVLAVAAASPVFAAEGKQCPGHMLPKELIDTDKDGTLSAEEMKAFQDKRFAKADSNRDGAVDANEFLAMQKEEMERRHEAMFKRMDADGDGKLSREEMKPPHHAGKKGRNALERCDADKNGELSDDEKQNCRPQRHERMHGNPGNTPAE